jgi:hypothetical protein
MMAADGYMSVFEVKDWPAFSFIRAPFKAALSYLKVSRDFV